MEEKNKVEKINFLKKVWYSITDFEKYPVMAAEGTKNAIMYLIVMLSIVSLFISIGYIIKMKNAANNFANYVQNNIPDFTYTQGVLAVDSNETIVIDSIDYDGIQKIVIDTLVETKEQKEKLLQENVTDGVTIFYFRDEMLVQDKTEENKIISQSYQYDECIAEWTKDNTIQQFNKHDMIEHFKGNDRMKLYIQGALWIYLYVLIIHTLVGLLDALEIAIFGLITGAIAKIKINMGALYSMSAYSLTLSCILNIIYIVVNYFTEYTINNANMVWIAISYIYIAAVIFILKDDVMKKMQEVEKIRQEQLKVKREIEIENNKKKKEEDEKEEGNETQGSET